MSSYQRYMPQQNHLVNTRGRQQYQQPPPPPPEPTIKENIKNISDDTIEIVNRLTNVEAKLDKIIQFLQTKQPQSNTNPILNNNNIPTGNIFD